MVHMSHWGRSGLAVLCDTYYFFNYSAATQNSASVWDSILASPAWSGAVVSRLVRIRGGVVASVHKTGASVSLHFLTNSTPHGDWRGAVLGGVDADSRFVNSLVAVSSSIVAFGDGRKSAWSFWNLSEPALEWSRGESGMSMAADGSIMPFCTLRAPDTDPPTGQLLGATSLGDLMLGITWVCFSESCLDECSPNAVREHGGRQLGALHCRVQACMPEHAWHH